MIPHIQTNTSKVNGNCWQTAIASVLDLPIESVPHFVGWEVSGAVDDYWLETWTWLFCRGWVMNNINRHLYTGEDYLVLGETERETFHVCIYRNGRMVHDPHPSGAGLVNELLFVTIRQNI